MKKKFLSLMMAAAVVATTSVSAFAADVNQSYDVTENQEQEAQINIKGDVANNDDNILPSTISVTVPTAATFKVDKNGKLTAPDINITSNSTDKVEVIAYSFKDTTPDDGITVVSKTDIGNGESVERTKVSLTLGGNEDTVTLKSVAGTSKGIYKLNGTDAVEENTVIGTVTSTAPLKLELTGTAGKQNAPLTTAVSDKFTLVLKLKKAR